LPLILRVEVVCGLRRRNPRRRCRNIEFVCVQVARKLEFVQNERA